MVVKVEDKRKSAPQNGDVVARERVTPGEKWYHRLSLVTNFVGTFISSGLIAFGILDNKWYQNNVVKPLGDRIGQGASKNFNQTFWLMQGGNLMIIPMHYMEKKKDNIVQYFNRKFGTSEDVAAYEQKDTEVTKRTWGDFIKGRIAAFLTVWASFTLAGKFWGEQMNKFEHGTGEKFAQLFKKPAFEQDGTTPTLMNKIGRMFSLDFFATVAAVAILDGVAGFFSKHKQPKESSKESLSQKSEPQVAYMATREGSIERTYTTETSRTTKPESRGSYREEAAEEKAKQTTLAIA